MDWAAAWQTVLDWLYPQRCGLCGRLGPDRICKDCRDEMVAAEEPARPGPMHSPLETIYTLWSYEGRAGQAVRRLKYSRVTALAAPMAEMMAEHYLAHGLDVYDIVAPVPIHRSRGRQRGFNQAELLCENLPADRVQARLLIRTRRTKPQVELSASKRVLALRNAFAAAPDVAGKAVLLIDDVVTTGGTAIACAEALAASGASRVAVLAFCGERPLRPAN